MHRHPLVLFLLAALLTQMVGCNAVPKTPTNRLAAAKVTMTTLQEGFALGHDTGVISDEMLVEKIDPPMQAGFRAISVAERLLEQAGGNETSEFTRWLNLALEAITILEAFEQEQIHGGSVDSDRGGEERGLSHRWRDGTRGDREGGLRPDARADRGDRPGVRGREVLVELACRGRPRAAA